MTFPSEVSGRKGIFDRMADRASAWVSKAWFFAACVLLVVLWAPSLLLLSSVDTWQLIINTVTTIITFLLMALLQNTQHRADAATQQKLNAIAAALAAALPEPEARELRKAVGLEQVESS